MPRFSEALPSTQRLALAVAVSSPASLARTFASYAGQFYDREPFDALARQVSDLYATHDSDEASYFRARLDRRLCDRYRAPVAWEVGSARADRLT